MSTGTEDAYYLLAREHHALNDSVKVLATLQKGYERYPNTLLIIFELVNFYLSYRELKEAL